MQAKTKSKTKAAKALFDLYQAMPDEVQKEVKDLILLAEKSNSSNTDELTIISYDAFGDIWDAPENDHWDNFLKKQS